jgi:hypothetical protein
MSVFSDAAACIGKSFRLFIGSILLRLNLPFIPKYPAKQKKRRIHKECGAE